MKGAGIVVALAVSGTAAAQPASAPTIVASPSAPPGEVVTSYAATTLVLDAVSYGAAIAGGALEADGLFLLGAAGLLFATPIVHGTHGHGQRGVGSFLLRVTCGGLGGVIGARAFDLGGEWGFVGGAVIGVYVGIAPVVVLDAFLAKDRRPRRHVVVPAVTPATGGGAVLSLTGAF